MREICTSGSTRGGALRSPPTLPAYNEPSINPDNVDTWKAPLRRPAEVTPEAGAIMLIRQPQKIRVHQRSSGAPGQAWLI